MSCNMCLQSTSMIDLKWQLMVIKLYIWVHKSEPFQSKLLVLMYSKFCDLYCNHGNCRVVVTFALCLLRENYLHAKIKPICLYEGNRSSIVKFTPTWDVLPLYANIFAKFSSVKITTFTVHIQTETTTHSFSFQTTKKYIQCRIWEPVVLSR